MLLREHLREQALKIDDDDDTKASYTRQAFLSKENGKNTATPDVQPQGSAKVKGRPAEKATLTQITTPEVSVVLQKGFASDRISDACPKV